MKNCEDCAHRIITPDGIIRHDGACDVCYGHKKWVSKYDSSKNCANCIYGSFDCVWCLGCNNHDRWKSNPKEEEKEMKKYDITMKRLVTFRTSIDAECPKDATKEALKLFNNMVFKRSDVAGAEFEGRDETSKYGASWSGGGITVDCTRSKRPLILLCGKSGSGKTTVANLLQSKYGLKQLESCTTRPPRKDGEVGHLFTNLGIFSQHIREGKVIAQADINGYKYWATKEQLDNADIYVIDPKTALELEKKIKDERNVIFVYLDVSIATSVYRMTKRGDSLGDIRKRINNEAEWHEFAYITKNTGIIIDTDTRGAEQVAESIMAFKEKCE